MSTKWTYLFSRENTEGSKDLVNLLGGKGANLAEMASLGLNVPPGFTISTAACLDYQQTGKISEEIRAEILHSLKKLEKISDKKFGDPLKPLLVSVRSGARVSMPGMMDTVLNLGLNEKIVEGLAKTSNDERFAWDSYRRFIQMYANVVLGMNTSLLEIQLEDLKSDRGVEFDHELQAEDLKSLARLFKQTVMSETGISISDDPMEQLWPAIEAVFKSWNNARAIKYREVNNISHDWGTGVNIQSMVFGNLGNTCGTGVCFSRNPSNGDDGVFGEYLINAQGEDVVAGIRTPAPINENSKNSVNQSNQTLQELFPKVYQELEEINQKLEKHYRDMQDIEFTIEHEKLYLLQTRSAKRTARAALSTAIKFENEGLITKKEALMRVTPEQMEQLLHPSLDPEAAKNPKAKGLPASPGAACGYIAFTTDQAVEMQKAGKNVIFVRHETSPEDISGMIASVGILTARGGMTSHAAVVARGMGKTCVVGCSSLVINQIDEVLIIGSEKLRSDQKITIEGSSGKVFIGEIPMIEAQLGDEFDVFMNWSDEFKKLGVRANADNSNDTKNAKRFGAKGIGLCRTEHMFFDQERILAVRQMIFAANREDRVKSLEKILPFQQEDFEGIFKELNGEPCNIRLLDPPLHEFLPHSSQEVDELAVALEITAEEVNSRIAQLSEFNPMLGHRGCRLGLTYPEIYDVQVKAIVQAAYKVFEGGQSVEPEIMIPLIATKEEFIRIKERTVEIINSLSETHSNKVTFKIGTMIELPRAAITAGEIAPHVDFFSFGTNDLTQTTYGLSRDDSGKFLPFYIDSGLIEEDPFVSIDKEGVGFLVEHACREGRKNSENIHLGICGEHGGDPKSVHFCHQIGLDYVSCSPFRVPIARLAAAQAAILYV